MEYFGFFPAGRGCGNFGTCEGFIRIRIGIGNWKLCEMRVITRSENSEGLMSWFWDFVIWK